MTTSNSVFPQQSSVVAIKNGLPYVRYQGFAEGAGDMFESESGAKGFAVGPESDLTNYIVTYPDSQAGDGVSSQGISIEKPLVGRIGPDLSKNYPGSAIEVPSRMLISYDHAFPPPLGQRLLFYTPQDKVTFDGGGLTVFPPQVDLIQYLEDVPNLVRTRSKKEYRVAAPVDGTPGVNVGWFWLFPFYGRTQCYFTVKNNSSQIVTIYRGGLNFSTVRAAVGGNTFGPGHQEVAFSTAVVAAGAFTEGGMPAPTVAAEARRWDYVYLGLTSPSNVTPLEFQSVEMSVFIED